MGTYIALITETQHGEKHFDDTLSRAAKFRDEVSALGVTVRDTYWTLGECDGILIFDAPDDETAAVALHKLTGAGAVRTRTLRAFNAEQMEGILKRC